MRKIISIATACIAIIAGATKSASALIPIPTQDGGFEYGGYSIGDLDGVSSSGNFEADPAIIDMLGYDPSRSWQKGDSPADIFKIGDFEAYGLGQLSLQDIAQYSDIPYNPQELQLNQLGLLEGQSVYDLIENNSTLKNAKVSEFTPLADILGSEFDDYAIDEIVDRDPEELNDLFNEARINALNQQLASQINQIQDATNTILDANYSTIASDLGENIEQEAATALNTAISTGQQQAATAINAATAAATQNITDFVRQNTQLSDIEVNQYIDSQIDSLKEEISNQINAGSQALQSELDSLSQELGVDFDIEDSLAEVQTLAESQIDSTVAAVTEQINQTISNEVGKIAQDLGFDSDMTIGDIEIGDYDLSEYTVEDVPGADEIPLEDFEGYENFNVSDFPGLSQMDVKNFPIIPSFGTGVALVDLVLSNAEKYTANGISGGGADVFLATPCNSANDEGKGCAHIELGGPLFINEGKQWVMGKSQKVEGGKNSLKSVNNGKEPTGRMPFPKAPFKMVLNKPDESTDIVSLELAFRFCFVDPSGTEHCTPYGLFNVPVMDFKVADYIFLGPGL